MRIRQNENSYLLHLKEKQGEIDNGMGFLIFRERELLLSRFSAVRIIGSRRSKKQSRSMRRGLHVDTNLVEFRQL